MRFFLGLVFLMQVSCLDKPIEQTRVNQKKQIGSEYKLKFLFFNDPEPTFATPELKQEWRNKCEEYYQILSSKHLNSHDLSNYVNKDQVNKFKVLKFSIQIQTHKIVVEYDTENEKIISSVFYDIANNRQVTIVNTEINPSFQLKKDFPEPTGIFGTGFIPYQKEGAVYWHAIAFNAFEIIFYDSDGLNIKWD